MGRGGEEAEDDKEDEDKEELVVLGDAGCAAMRVGAALRAAAASAAATAGRMEGIHSGCGFGGRWLEEPGRNLAACWAHSVSGGA